MLHIYYYLSQFSTSLFKYYAVRRIIIKTQYNNNSGILMNMAAYRSFIFTIYYKSFVIPFKVYRHTVGFEYLSLISAIGVAHCLSCCM